MNRKIVGAMVASLALLGPAMAQDGHVWTGFYTGLHAGYAAGNVGLPLKGSLASSTQTYPLNVKADADAKGFLGGAQVGYNYQLPSNWLVGIEADASLADITASSGTLGSLTGTPFGTLDARANSSVRWLATVRGRVGYVTGNDMLIYATGGFAYGGVRSSASLKATGVDAKLIYNTIGTGWTMGAGVEKPIASNLTLRTEYLYSDLGGVKLLDGPLTINTSTASMTGTASLKAEHTAHIFRIGLNYALN